MSKIDYLGVDAALLKTLIILHEEQSVSFAAERLGLTQSALSHRLTRLRTLFGPNLFVRSGRKIASPPETEHLVAEARTVLSRIERMVNPQPLSLDTLDDTFVLAATDYERHLFLLAACKEMLSKAPALQFGLVWEKYDNRAGLRDGQFDLVCGPLTERNDPDLHSEAVYTDEFLCFYDPEQRDAPTSLEAYLSARHVRMIFSANDTSFVDNALSMVGRGRSVAVDIPSLSEVPYAVAGTQFVVTAPSLTGKNVLKDFASCPVPFAIPRLSFGMEWHDRTDASPRHQWVRDTIRRHTQKATESDG